MVFQKIWKGLTKTRDKMGEQLRTLFSMRQLDEDFLEQLEEVLYTADLGPTASEILEEVQQAYKSSKIKNVEEVRPLLEEILLGRLHGESLPKRDNPPTVILVAGVNGSGKTTSIAKLASWLRKQNYSVMLAAGDTFRAAAVEQLTIWSERLGVEIIKQSTGADPAAVAFDALEAAMARQVDYLIVDTAGRLHTQKNLMAELEKIKRVLQKKDPTAPHEVLMVLDATTGQNAIRQAEEFQKAIEVTGLFVTKLDGTAKGGAVFGIQRQLNLPIRFIGVGESVEDIEPFDRERAESFVTAILGENSGNAIS